MRPEEPAMLIRITSVVLAVTALTTAQAWGASVGVDSSDQFSGYRVDHNTIRENTLFAIDAGSAGAQPSRFDHNTLTGNGYGLVSGLTDDTLWPQPPAGSDRHAYARNLRNA